MKIKSILFPTDFSEKSVKAREHVLYLGDALGSDIHILHAIEPLDYEEMDEEIMEFYRSIEVRMEDNMAKEARIFSDSDIKIHSEIIIGQRYQVINNYALEHDIDLIVMGSHGLRSDTGDMSVGTTSHKVVFTSPCPVLIVRH